MRLVDIHSHILPTMDDGAKDVEISVKMLNMYKEQGVTDIFATPHFMPMEDTLDGFLEKRKACFDILSNETNGFKDFPNVHLGGEFYYYTGIGRCSELNSLKLEGTNYILVELPIEPISNYLIEDIKQIKENANLIPIIAHIERLSFQRGFKKLLSLFSDEYALAQINAISVLNKPFDKKVKKLIKNGFISFIGSDAHSDTLRPPKMQEALDFIKNNISETAYYKIINNMSEKIFENGENR